MNCANHPDVEKVAFCRTCGKPLCANCTRPPPVATARASGPDRTHTSATRATFEASRSRLNMLSPKKAPPMAMR